MPPATQDPKLMTIKKSKDNFLDTRNKRYENDLNFQPTHQIKSSLRNCSIFRPDGTTFEDKRMKQQKDYFQESANKSENNKSTATLRSQHQNFRGKRLYPSLSSPMISIFVQH